MASKHRALTSEENLNGGLTRDFEVQDVFPNVLIDDFDQKGAAVGEEARGVGVGGVAVEYENWVSDRRRGLQVREHGIIENASIIWNNINWGRRGRTGRWERRL